MDLGLPFSIDHDVGPGNFWARVGRVLQTEAETAGSWSRSFTIFRDVARVKAMTAAGLSWTGLGDVTFAPAIPTVIARGRITDSNNEVIGIILRTRVGFPFCEKT